VRSVVARLTAAAIAALAVVAAGCGTEASERDARSSVERFYAAIDARDGGGACRELSEDASSSLETSAKEPCEQAVLSLELTRSAVGQASVWVTSAQVSLEGGDTVFLDQIGGDWRIGAAGCEARPGQPYECELEG
jgi:hypothetical protein